MEKLEQVKMRMFPDRGTGAGDVSLYMYGERMEFEILAEEFHNVAKARVEDLRKTRSDPRCWQSIGSNYVAIPVVYNYRHALELYLKGMLVAAEPALTFALGQPGINDGVFCGGHSFRKLFPEIERVFQSLKVPFDFGIDGLTTKADFQTFLHDLDWLDVRFPIDTKRNPAMGNKFVRFNLFEFAEKMDVILNRLNGYISWIDDAAQNRCEMAQEAREAAWENADYDPPDYEREPYYAE